MDYGFHPDTALKLENGNYSYIKDIHIGELLFDHIKVLGIVKINVDDLQLYRYKINNKQIVGTRNLIVGDQTLGIFSTLENNKHINNKVIYTDYHHSVYYHLITDKRQFYISDILFFDYSSTLEYYIDTDYIKLLKQHTNNL